MNHSQEDKEKKEKEVSEEDMKGVPEFWLTIFKNVELLIKFGADLNA